jgi:hypothetical protein
MARVGQSNPIDYDRMIALDAEDLAETGIAEAYERVGIEAKRLGVALAPIKEQDDPDEPSYSVQFGAKTYKVYDKHTDVVTSWENATWIFFEIVNAQMTNGPYRFYALMGGNDLHGIFMTDAEMAKVRGSSLKMRDWPYLPTANPPLYGRRL